jgi:hypothetical protein
MTIQQNGPTQIPTKESLVSGGKGVRILDGRLDRMLEEFEKRYISSFADLEKSGFFFPGFILSNLPSLHNPEVALYLFLSKCAYQRLYFSKEVFRSGLGREA